MSKPSSPLYLQNRKKTIILDAFNVSMVQSTWWFAMSERLACLWKTEWREENIYFWMFVIIAFFSSKAHLVEKEADKSYIIWKHVTQLRVKACWGNACILLVCVFDNIYTPQSNSSITKFQGRRFWFFQPLLNWMTKPHLVQKPRLALQNHRQPHQKHQRLQEYHFQQKLKKLLLSSYDVIDFDFHFGVMKKSICKLKPMMIT